MRTCPQCGAAEPDGAQWCAKCYLPFAPAPAVQAGFAGVVVPAPAAVVAAPSGPPSPQATPGVDVTWATPSGPPAVAPPAVGLPPWAPPQPGAPAMSRTATGRLLSGRALAIVGISIGFGGIMQLVVYLLVRSQHFDPDTIIRVAIVATVFLYAAVAGVLLSQITPKVRLRWGEGSPVARAALGLAIGAGLSGLLLWAVSSARGHLSPDPNILLMMSSGDAMHIIVVSLLACAAAPLVEETLFRGLLLESLRQHHLGMAIIVSSMFFAVWHFNPRNLLYYTILGAVLAGVYVWRGLVASMAAHFGFNAVLTLAAISLVLGPARHYDLQGMRFTVPGSWDPVTDAVGVPIDPSQGLILLGPDGAQIGIGAHLTQGPDDLQHFAQGVTSGASAGGLQLAPQTIQLPVVGQAIDTKFGLPSGQAEILVFQYGGEDYAVYFENHGSTKADRDFTKMLETLQPSPAGTSVS